jgi:hypothetical protein
MRIVRCALAIVCTSLSGLQCVSAQNTLLAPRDTQELREQNSKLRAFYSGNRTLDDYVELQNAKKDEPADQPIVISDNAPREGLVGANPNEKSREAYILDATANSDLIVVAEPLLRNSAATETRRFIFSDYEVVINRIFLARDVTVLPGQKIVITRPGGILQYRGRTLVGSVPGFELFTLNEPYMVFLRLLPNGTFLIVGESAYNLTGEQVDIDRERKTQKNGTKKLVPKDQFVEDVERAAKRLARTQLERSPSARTPGSLPGPFSSRQRSDCQARPVFLIEASISRALQNRSDH